MDDQDVIKTFNEQAEKTTNGTRTTSSFIFTLKNRVGGLARALRVFQVFYLNKYFGE